MQHHRPDRQSRRDRRRIELPRQRAADPVHDVDHAAGSQQLGQQHRHCLEHVDLVLGVAPRQAVLHGHDAQRPPRPSQRHGEQRRERILPGLRPVGEGRMTLRVRQVLHGRRRRCDPDDPLAHAQPRPPDRALIEPFGRHQLEHVARPHGIDGAHFGHHLAGDQHRQIVQRGLSARRPVALTGRHHGTQPGQQTSATGHAVGHQTPAIRFDRRRDLETAARASRRPARPTRR